MNRATDTCCLAGKILSVRVLEGVLLECNYASYDNVPEIFLAGDV